MVAYYLRSTRLEDYEYLATAVPILYDYIASLPDEIELIWMFLRMNSTSIIFMLNRLSALGYVTGQVLLAQNWSTDAGCYWNSVTLLISLVLQFVVWLAFSTLRVYALTGGDMFPTLLVLVSASATGAPIGMTVYEYRNAYSGLFDVESRPIAYASCELRVESSRKTNNLVSWITGACLLLADIIVLTITWQKTYRVWKDGKAVGINTPLAKMMLKKGLWYLVGSLAIFIVQGSLTAAGLPVIANLYPIAMMIIISHFILDMRRFSADIHSSTGPTLTENSHFDHQLAELRFGSLVVGDMGADLDGGFRFDAQQDRWEDEEETGADAHRIVPYNRARDEEDISIEEH